jgi:hypothetical protein
VRQRLVGLAKEHGFDMHDLFGKGLEGTVAVTRGTVAATKGGKARKEDFLVWGP